jgi:hypothetical protein
MKSTEIQVNDRVRIPGDRRTWRVQELAFNGKRATVVWGQYAWEIERKMLPASDCRKVTR